MVRRLPMAPLLVQPTPVTRAQIVSRVLGCEVLVKHDDRSHPLLGGNKVRKLDRILEQARRLGATDLVTVGAIGSNHLLATAVHGRAAGFEVTVIATPHPSNPDVRAAAAATLGAGATTLGASGTWQVPFILGARLAVLRARGRRPFFIPPGGSSVAGTLGYADAIAELAGQVDAVGGWPDVIICTLGSGGMHAGLVAGIRAHGVACRIIGVRATERWMVTPAKVLRLARGAARALRTATPILKSDVDIRDDQLGPGYGLATEASQEAMALFAQDGVVLDPTYTGKAAAALLSLARADNRPRRWLFWNSWGGVPARLPVMPLPESLMALLR